MSGFKAPSDDWLSEEVAKQKRRDAEEMEQDVVVVEDDPEEVIGADGEPKWMPGDPDDGPIVVPPTRITPEEHRAFGLEHARRAFHEALSLVDLGREWLDSIGYRDATRERADGAAGVLVHVIELIEAREGIER